MTKVELLEKLTDKLETLPLNSPEYQNLKTKIKEIDFLLDFDSEFGYGNPIEEED